MDSFIFRINKYLNIRTDLDCWECIKPKRSLKCQIQKLKLFKKNLSITASSVVIDRINLKADSSGQWDIGVTIPVEVPLRAGSESIRIFERHTVTATIKITKAEIGVAAGIAEDQVTSTLNLTQLETIVTQLAMSKLFAIFSFVPA